MLALAAIPATAAPRVFLPDGRATRPGNEWIAVSVATGDPAGLSAGHLQLTLTGDDGSKLSFFFSDPQTHVLEAPSSSTVNLHLDGWLLRPEHYIVTATVGGATAQTALTTTNPVPKSVATTHTEDGDLVDAIKVATPTLLRDYTLNTEPLTVNFAVAALSSDGSPISGDSEVSIRVTDPAGGVRYDIVRNVSLGTRIVSLPLAVNDPPGTWKVTATARGHSDSATFVLPPVSTAGAVAGVSNRAVYFNNDRKLIFGFLRVHNNITIVQGSSGFSHEQASRLADILKPWNITANIVDAAGALPDGPVVLVGNPDDNSAIAAIIKAGAITPTLDKASYPGPNNGLIGYFANKPGAEIAYAIGYDADGLKQAVGSMYEATAGMDPLTTFVLPGLSTITAGSAHGMGKPGV